VVNDIFLYKDISENVPKFEKGLKALQGLRVQHEGIERIEVDLNHYHLLNGKLYFIPFP